MVKYRIRLMESERGWGQNHWTEDYDSYEAAQKRIRDVNAQNTASTAPDWYMVAETTIEAVKDD